MKERVTNKSIEEALVEEIKGDSIKELVVDGAEFTLDQILEDEVLKDIPFFGTLYKLYKTAGSINEAIFTKKVYKFLVELKDIPQEKRESFIKDLQEDPKYRSKVGERLLMIINQLDDMDKPGLIGKIFKHAVGGDITYDDFLRLSTIVQRSYLPDLLKLEESANMRSYDRNIVDGFITLGIVSIELDKNIARKRASMSTLGGNPDNVVPDVKYELNLIGKKLVDILRDKEVSYKIRNQH